MSLRSPVLEIRINFVSIKSGGNRIRLEHSVFLAARSWPPESDLCSSYYLIASDPTLLFFMPTRRLETVLLKGSVSSSADWE